MTGGPMDGTRDLIASVLAEGQPVLPLVAVGRQGLRMALLARHSVLANDVGVGVVLSAGETAAAILDTGKAWLLIMHGDGYAVVELIVERTASEDGDVLFWSRPGAITARTSPDAQLLPPSFIAGEGLAVRERWVTQQTRLRDFADGAR
jgi:hypothetical protein